MKPHPFDYQNFAKIRDLLEWEVLDQTFGIRLGETSLAVSWMNDYAGLNIDELFDVVAGQLVRGGWQPEHGEEAALACMRDASIDDADEDPSIS